MRVVIGTQLMVGAAAALCLVACSATVAVAAGERAEVTTTTRAIR